MFLQNLREAIANYRSSILRQPDEMKRAASLSFFVEYLERYYFLICFAVYIHTERAALQPTSSDQVSFSDWMRARPELYSILRRWEPNNMTLFSLLIISLCKYGFHNVYQTSLMIFSSCSWVFFSITRSYWRFFISF